MSPSPSDLLEGLAATVASIEDADHTIDELDVTLTDGAPDGQVQVTVPLFGDDLPEESRVTLTSAGIDGSDLVVDLEIEIDQGRERSAVEAEQLETASADEDRSTDATASTSSDTDETIASESGPDADTQTQAEDSTADPDDDTKTAAPNPGDAIEETAEESDPDDAIEETTTDSDPGDAIEETTAESDPGDAIEETTTAKSSEEPAYRDPDRLAAVYNPEATFAEMTEELGVDVTAQTVRKYMIEHGIHDPAPRQSESGADTEGSESEAESKAQSDPSKGVGESEDLNRTEPEEIDDADVDEPTQGNKTDADRGKNDSDDTRANDDNDSEDTRANDDNDSEDTRANGDKTSAGSSPDRGEVPTKTDESRRTREIIPPTRLPDGVTMEGLVEVLTRSRTVYEVQRGLDLDGKQTRSLLHRLNLIDLVTGRINKGDTPPTKEQVLNRLADGDRGPDQAEV